MGMKAFQQHLTRPGHAALWVTAALLVTSCSAIQGPTVEGIDSAAPPTITSPSIPEKTPSSSPQSTQGTPPSSAAASSPAAVPSASPPGDAAIGLGADAPAVAEPTRLTVSAADIDMPILALAPTEANLANQSLVPPFTEEAYWITAYGQPGAGSNNTTYITGHSWLDRNAPFNRLSTQVQAGDAIVLATQTGSIDYVVDSVTVHDKETLKNSDIWDIVPNRLVLITCFIDDPWGKNVVITATPA